MKEDHKGPGSWESFWAYSECMFSVCWRGLLPRQQEEAAVTATSCNGHKAYGHHYYWDPHLHAAVLCAPANLCCMPLEVCALEPLLLGPSHESTGSDSLFVSCHQSHSKGACPSSALPQDTRADSR
jgi:hypothetical protein